MLQLAFSCFAFVALKDLKKVLSLKFCFDTSSCFIIFDCPWDLTGYKFHILVFVLM